MPLAAVTALELVAPLAAVAAVAALTIPALASLRAIGSFGACVGLCAARFRFTRRRCRRGLGAARRRFALGALGARRWFQVGAAWSARVRLSRCLGRAFTRRSAVSRSGTFAGTLAACPP